MKIMVVENIKSTRDEIVNILELESFEVIEAENGMLGLQYSQKYLPDLILCDLLLPDFDGFTLLKLIREEPATSNTPFIFLTDKFVKKDFRNLMDLGADDYLTKPFTSEDLIKSIKTRLEKNENINKTNDDKFDSLCENIVYSLPHEFITPLTAILGYSELLIDTAKELNVIKIAEGINIAGNRLEKLIQNFIVYSQLEILLTNPEKMSLTQKIYINNPGSVIKETALFKAKKLKREKDLIINVEDANVQVSTENLKKIIEELIDNAFKFSINGDYVNLKVNITKDFYTIEIIDNGRGMSLEDISRIDPYMQFERKLYEQQGMGLGLTISQKLVELHGGNMYIESSIGSGTKIIIILKSKPLSKSDKKYSRNEHEIYEMGVYEMIQ